MLCGTIPRPPVKIITTIWNLKSPKASIRIQSGKNPFREEKANGFHQGFRVFPDKQNVFVVHKRDAC